MDLLDLYDDYQEVARCAFADMLHDSERNAKYSSGIKEAIETMHARGLEARVLDIGTGTGLLSMLAVRHGADSVHTCEAFGPVFLIAKKIIEKNGFKDRIKMIPKHSTSMVLNVDMPSRANILVAEVLDTELIGEGALETYRHAFENLMEKDCLSVPSAAGIFVQVVESALASSWNKPKLLANLDGEVQLSVPKNVLNCSGAPSIHDIQLSQFPMDSFKSLIGPVKVLDIEFSGSSIRKNELNVVPLNIDASGQANAIFFWWDIKMNPSGSILLSCAPHWSHPETKNLLKLSDSVKPANVLPWRDHWMQGVYFLKDNVLLEKSHSAELAIFHDEYSWSFDISAGKQNKFSEVNRPSCDCWFHLVNSRNRIGQLNDNFNRNKKFMKFFEQMDFQKEDCVLVLGDNSFLGALLGKTVGKVYIIEENSLGKKVMNNFIQYNSLQEKVEVLDNLENVEVSNKVTHIFTEPHFLSASLPWDHITILFNKLKSLSSILDLTTIKHISQSARILAVPVHFLHLYKIRHPLVQCESFDHTIFDDFVEHASSIADKNTETFSLWEYPCIALGPSACLMNFDLTGKTEQKMKEKIELFIQSTLSKCNGVALWMEYELSKNITINNGPVKPIQLDNQIEWNINARQAVHLIKDWELEAIKSITSSCKLSSNNEILMTFTKH